MRLSKIKLAGFKSFVDPTAINLPSNLTGVVGPNGCGKSNIIDAVRWVMGEISAKHLRGDSMSDVIFNGSGGRKPVGTASVELVFDNTDGTISGAYASFAEVSLKRVVSRDGTSTYFINGSRCRRKDITQLFLGTGLGSRSYAIIEQGMISRLIEAKPDDMRAFIEEAAGISRYKERRRETESRIAHTRENLERLNDLREEVDKQIRHLQRQAAVARRFRELKEQERRLHAELLVLRLNDLEADRSAKDQLSRERELAMQAAIATLRGSEAGIERARALHAERNDELGGVQGRYYQAGAEAARSEQALRHARELRDRLRNDLESVTTALDEARVLLTRDQQQLDELTAMMAEGEPELDSARAAEEASRAALASAEQAMQQWQSRWEEFSTAAAAASRKTLVERTRIEQLELRLNRLLSQRERLERDREALTAVDLESEAARAASLEQGCRESVARLQAAVAGTLESLHAARARERTLGSDLDAARNAAQQARGRLVSLEALQKAALGQVQGRVVEWLAGHGLAGRPRVAEQIEVESGWERAVETVLGDYLEAVCVDGLDAVAEVIDGLSAGRVGFVSLESAAQTVSSGLAAKIRGPGGLPGLLAGVSAVDTLAEALALRRGLRPGESVITRDGIWIGQGWLRVTRDQDAHAGVLERERELRTLREAAAEAAERATAIEASLAEAREELRRLEDRRDDEQREANAAHRDQVNARAQLDSLRARAQQASQRVERLVQEIGEAAASIAADEAETRTARQALEEGLAEMQSLEDRRAPLEAERERLRTALDDARRKAAADTGAMQQVAIRVESQRSTIASVRNALDRVQHQVSQYSARRAQVESQLAEGEAPIAQLEQALQGQLELRLAVEQELTEARRALDEADARMRELEQERLGHETAVNAAREAFEQIRFAVQETQLRRDSVLEQFAATRLELDDVRAQIPAEAGAAAWESSLAEVTGKIERLGAVNLASIEELTEQTERKEYLDRQFADLTEALNTLDEAIRKIDRETRTRFQDTFDRVNAGLKEKFPRLFGGGTAYLELVGEEVLSSGVTVMARPPGKRNATISQLSGGEKALTAVALVFSIFELNPAPFCILDEVDAPLDDHNVNRFCDIVREMSERVQFIFVTHNKSTMELARQLLGVTMNEPGVSRLVAVDVDEAVRMAAS
jgi:chromosome segregation protein